MLKTNIMNENNNGLNENQEISESMLVPQMQLNEANGMQQENPTNSSQLPQQGEAPNFTSSAEYVGFIRELIRTNTPPKAWLSIDMLEELLKEKFVPDYYLTIGYDSLERFLADPQYKDLWRTDKQYNSPFLIRHSYGKEIKQYVDTVADSILGIYLENRRESVALNTLVEKMNGYKLPISYSSMGFPSFEVFLVDKRFAHLWHAEKTKEFSIMLQPAFKGRDFFLDKLYRSVANYFENRNDKPNAERLIHFFRRGAAGKLYHKYGYNSLEELAQDPFFSVLRSDSTGVGAASHRESDRAFPEGTIDPKARRELVEQINTIYTKIAKEDGWVSLTAIASRIPSIRPKLQAIHFPSLSRFVQANAELEQWESRYTETVPPDFQIRWLKRPSELPATESATNASEPELIAEISEQIAQIAGRDGWVLLAVLGQYIRDMKKRLEVLGYPTLGAFVKEKADEAGWTYCYFDNLAAKLSVRLRKSGDLREVKSERLLDEVSAPKEPAISGEQFLEPGYCLTLRFEDQTVLNKLASMAEKEPWSFNNVEEYQILQYLLRATLVRSAAQRLIVRYNEGFAFNTGLVTPEGAAIIAEVREEKLGIGPAYVKFANVLAFSPELETALGGLPTSVRYFDFSRRMPLETFLCNPDKPLPVVDWKAISKRGVEEATLEDLQAALERSWKRLYRQLRLANPCYAPETDEIHLLLPLYLKEGEGEASTVIELVWRSRLYEAVALHTIADAYMMARTVSKITPLFG